MNSILALGLPGGWEWLIVFLAAGIGLVSLILWLWALIDCVQSEFQGENKVIWILIILLVPTLGAILYLVIGRSQKIKKY